MSVQIARETDGHVSITVAPGSKTNSVVLSPVEARLLAIKLLLAAEDVRPSDASRPDVKINLVR
jgi:hypothetical protein